LMLFAVCLLRLGLRCRCQGFQAHQMKQDCILLAQYKLQGSVSCVCRQALSWFARSRMGSSTSVPL
jgi:hypothetical protein